MPREPIAANDAIWLQDSVDNRMIINAVITLDRLDPAALLEAFRARILAGPEAARFARLRCRIGGTGRRRYWEPDPDFDLSRHIVPARAHDLHDLAALRAFVGQEAGRGLDWDHPQWQIQVVEDFLDGGSALLVRIHHSIGDGEALVDMFASLVDGGLGDRPGPPPAPPAPALLDRLARAAAIPLSAPGILLRRLTWLPDRGPLHGPALSGTKRVAWTQPLDLEVVKRAKRVLGATVNDVLMASVSGAFSSYLAALGGEAPARFLVNMPMNVRAPGRPLRFDNHFAPVPLELPAGTAAHARRILEVKARLDRVKRSPVPQVIYELQRALLSFLPDPVSRGLIDFLANKCTAVVTNMSGPSRELALAGRRIRSMIFWVPQRARIGIGISILSLCGKVQVGILADANLVPDPEVLVAAFEREFEALKGLEDPEG